MPTSTMFPHSYTILGGPLKIVKLVFYCIKSDLQKGIKTSATDLAEC
jgi:hypothetical protein